MDVDFLPSRDRMGFVKIAPHVLILADIAIVRNNRGPATDDVLLGEFGGKIDED